MSNSIAVFGAGPGLGQAVARRFAREGYAVTLVGRRPEPLELLASDLTSAGATAHVVYHLYNWKLFEALLPIGRAGILERLSDIKLFLSERDTEAAAGVVRQLEKLFGGSSQPPIVE